MSREDDVALGRAVVADGRLMAMRAVLGVTRSAMAELLHTSPITYAAWERKPETILWPSTAERVGRFFAQADAELRLLEEEGVDLLGLIPLHIASSTLGLPQEQLLTRYNAGGFEAEDLGILGLWVRRSELARMRAER